MLKHSMNLAVAAFFATAGIVIAEDAAPSGPISADTIIATVDGRIVTLGHMIMLREALPQQYQDLPDNVLFDGLMDQLIRQSVLAGLVEEPTLETQLAIDNEIRSFLAGQAINARIDAAMTDEAIQALYDERFSELAPSQEYNAAHILLDTEEEALAVVDELAAGADFAEVARAKSTGPSGPNGGNLGWFGEGMMVPRFEAAVIAMEVGGISAPVQTQFGWHVINLIETRIKEAPALETVRSELEASLQETIVNELIEEALGNAEVVEGDMSGIDPSVLRNTDLIRQ